MKTEPNAFAFAAADASGSCTHGLTKREYFAALAMQGLMANPGENGYAGMSPRKVADTALTNADALIAALNAQEAQSNDS